MLWQRMGRSLCTSLPSHWRVSSPLMSGPKLSGKPTKRSSRIEEGKKRQMTSFSYLYVYYYQITSLFGFTTTALSFLSLSKSSSSVVIRVSEAACTTFSSFSLRKKLFHSEMEPLDAATAPQDITHTPTPQELLAHKVLQSLEEEKTESKRWSHISATNVDIFFLYALQHVLLMDLA